MARMFTVDEAAEYLHVTPYTIRKWLRKGKIPGRKIGRLYRIFEAELEAALRAPAEDVPESPESEEVARAKREEALEQERRRKQEEWKGLSREEKRRRIDAVVGKYAHVPFSSDDLIRERREEVEREEQKMVSSSSRRPSRKAETHERWLALSQEERDRRVRAARGMFAGGTRRLDDFLKEKHEEIEEEERRRQERHKPPGQTRGGETA